MQTTTLLPEKSAGIITSFADNELQSQIATTHSKCLAMSVELGKNHGRQSYPTAIDSLENATETITANYNELIVLSKQKLNGLLQVKMGSEQKQKIEQENKKLYSDLDQAQMELEKLKSEPMQEPAVKGPKYLFVLGLVLFCLILFGEIFYIAKSLQVARLNLFQSLIIAFSISLSIGAIAHYSPKKIDQWCNSLWVKILANFMVFGLVLLVFVVISYLRSSYMTKMNQQHTSLWVFTIFNFLLYVGLFFIDSGLIAPNYKKLQAIRLYKLYQSSVRTISEKVNDLTRAIETNKETLYQANSQRLLLISYAKSIEQQIVKLYMVSISQYKDANRYHREDMPPSCLNDKPAELELYYSQIIL